MVRVVLIRHGTTESNLRDARMAIAMAKGDLSIFGIDGFAVTKDNAVEAMTRVKAGLERDELSGDTNLSVHKGGGVEQAQRLADYWAPILQGKAETGSLHVFVSAMQRCQQTIDPMMKVLHESCGLTASIQPRICEVPGLCAPADQEFMEQEVFKRFIKGDDDAARAAMAAHDFEMCGLSRGEIAAQFPWATEFAEEFPEDGGWYTGGWESAADTAARIAGCKAWLTDMAATLPVDDMVVLVAHGDTIWKLFASIVGVDSNEVSHVTQNTSLSSGEHTSNPRDNLISRGVSERLRRDYSEDRAGRGGLFSNLTDDPPIEDDSPLNLFCQKLQNNSIEFRLNNDNCRSRSSFTIGRPTCSPRTETNSIWNSTNSQA